MNAHPNQWNDQLSIDTPELVALEFPLAGIGSRCLALIIDYLLQSVVLVLAVLALFAIAASAPTHPQTPARTPLADKWIVAILIAIPFFFQWCYFALFEAFWGGRTPGKRIMHLRVIQQNGRSISFIESLIRNFIRVVDFLPFLYVIGVVSIFVTKRNQRLGDLAAGTLVIHEEKRETGLWNGSGARSFTASMFDNAPLQRLQPAATLPADAVARLTKTDLESIDNFLARRLDLPLDVRAGLASRLAGQMKHRMQTVGDTGLSDETLLETIERVARNAS